MSEFGAALKLGKNAEDAIHVPPIHGSVSQAWGWPRVGSQAPPTGAWPPWRCLGERRHRRGRRRVVVIIVWDVLHFWTGRSPQTCDPARRRRIGNPNQRSWAGHRQPSGQQVRREWSRCSGSERSMLLYDSIEAPKDLHQRCDIRARRSSSCCVVTPRPDERPKPPL